MSVYRGKHVTIKSKLLFLLAPKILFSLQKIAEMSGTNLKPPNTEKCCTINSCVDIQINTGALCAFNTILWGKKAFKNIILFFLAFLIAARCYVMQKSMHSFYIIALNRIFFTNVTIRENNCWF